MCKEARAKKKHCCQQRAFFATNAPSKMRNCAVPPDHFCSKISSLTAFPKQRKYKKTREAIRIKCEGYFLRILIQFYTSNKTKFVIHLELCLLSLKISMLTKTNICIVQIFLEGKPCRNIGYFLCGVERVKRFVYVHLRCIVNNLKRISKTLTLPTLGKISADAHVTATRYFGVSSGQTKKFAPTGKKI